MAERPIPPAFGLDGKVALVTGAGSPTGIGRASAELLAELGATVAMAATSDRIDQRVADLAAAGHTVSGHMADLTDPQQARELVDDVADLHGRLDIVVNNAGMVSVTGGFEAGALESVSAQTWRAGLARNLDTAFFVSQAAVGYLPDTTGRIVNVSSVTGAVMAMRDEPVYAAAKAGMVGLTRSMALDMGPRGVTVNAVAPGWIATGSQTEDEARQALVTPLRRSASPGEVASVIAWLCTPGAAYVTGQCIVVDGGNSIAEERA